MSTIFDFKLFNNRCAGCGKTIRTAAISQNGVLPEVFCNRVCETKAAFRKRGTKNIVSDSRFSKQVV